MAVLHVQADMEARFEIDPQGSSCLAEGVTRDIKLPHGQHFVQLRPEEQAVPRKQEFNVSSALSNTLSVSLRKNPLRAAIESKSYWDDSVHNLSCGRSDNGSGVTVSQSGSFCRGFKQEG